MYMCVFIHMWVCVCVLRNANHFRNPPDAAYSCADLMGWPQLVGSMKLWVSFAKEPYKRDDILQKRPCADLTYKNM